MYANDTENWAENDPKVLFAKNEKDPVPWTGSFFESVLHFGTPALETTQNAQRGTPTCGYPATNWWTGNILMMPTGIR